MNIEINKDNRRPDYNMYYIFQNSSANPSGNYQVDPYFNKERILVSDDKSANNSSAVDFNSLD